jgi:hypothetical protein
LEEKGRQTLLAWHKRQFLHHVSMNLPLKFHTHIAGRIRLLEPVSNLQVESGLATGSGSAFAGA